MAEEVIQCTHLWACILIINFLHFYHCGGKKINLSEGPRRQCCNFFFFAFDFSQIIIRVVIFGIDTSHCLENWHRLNWNVISGSFLTKSIYSTSILLVRALWTAHWTEMSNEANTPKALLYIDLSSKTAFPLRHRTELLLWQHLIPFEFILDG